MLSILYLRNALSSRKHYEPFYETHDEKDGSSGVTYGSDPDDLRRLQRYNTALEGVCLVLSFVTILLGGLVWSQRSDMDRACLLHSNSYSPLLSEIPATLQEDRFNGSIRWPSPYRGPPSPSVDAAWDRVHVLRPLDINLTPDQFERIGQDIATAATNAPEHGGGIYAAPEFSHQLHCVNLLRKASYFKYDYYKQRDPDFQDSEATFKVHIDHCTEILRQNIMCHADVGIVTAHWIEQRGRPWPDFNTKHTCRDFEGILAWSKEHQLPEPAPMVPLKPAGAKARVKPL